MCRVFNSMLSIAAVAGLSAAAIGTRESSVEGVWRTAEVKTTGPGAQTITVVQPNLAILTAKHYSRLEIHSSQVRPNLVDAAKATADELRQVWGPVVAEAGSYETKSGNVLTLRPVVAKNPASMAAGSYSTYAYRIAGDTLWLTLERDQRGSVTNPPTIKLTRVE